MLDQNLKQLGSPRQLSKGSLLFGAGEPANGFYYLENGSIRIYKMSADGKEIEVNRLEKGDIFGEVMIFTDANYPVYAETLKKSTVLFFSKEIILKAIKKNPLISEFFINLLARKCILLNQRLESLTLQTVRQRICQYLLANSNDHHLIELSMKKSELAKNLGTISETLSRNLNQLQKAKIIKIKGKKIIIINYEKLKTALIS